MALGSSLKTLAQLEVGSQVLGQSWIVSYVLGQVLSRRSGAGHESRIMVKYPGWSQIRVSISGPEPELDLEWGSESSLKSRVMIGSQV